MAVAEFSLGELSLGKLSLNSLRAGLTEPLGYPFDPASRIYWLFLVSAAAMALLALYLQFRRRAGRGGFLALVGRSLFSRRHWLNRSTATDLGLLLGNSTLRALLIIPLLGSHLLATLWVARTLQTHLGNAPDWQLHWLAIASLYTLTFFLVEDLSRFSLHMAMHRVPFLWRFHRLHHSARRLTPLTLFRVHPVEMTLYYGRGLLVFGLVSGVFVYLFGRRLSGLDVLGVDILGFAFNFLGANLRHSHIWLTFGPMERWLISPAQHQLHHSAAPEHRDRNFGTTLTLWDRLLGTHIPAGARPRRLVFGIR
jgi:sterol desaturase/sphingolipid hydroxylase (fatty acid hydroxylase superfamily)